MKKQCLLTGLIFLTAVISLTAEESQYTIGIDMFGGIGMGTFGMINPDLSDPYFQGHEYLEEVGMDSFQLETSRMMLASIRFNIGFGVRYYLAKKFSVGGEIIYASVRLEETDKPLFLAADLPIYAIARYGSDKTFIQGFAGYNLSFGEFGVLEDRRFDGMFLGGAEVGVKAALGGAYLSASTVFTKYFTYPRFSLGYSYGLSF